MKFFDRLLGRGDWSYEAIPSDNAQQSTGNEALFVTEQTPLQAALICLRTHVNKHLRTPAALEMQVALEKRVLELMHLEKAAHDSYQASVGPAVNNSFKQ